MSIDPLAMKYTYNSPYAFQENKMGLGRELEGLELYPTQRDQFNSFAKEFAQSVAGTIDAISAKISGSFTIARDVAPNTTVETSQNIEAGTNFLNYINETNRDPSADVSMINVKTETKVEVKVSFDQELCVYGLDIKAEISNTTNVIKQENTTEVKATVGVAGNGAYISNSNNNTTGENTTRAGVQAEVATPKVANTQIKVGANFSVGQEEKVQ